MATTHFNNFVVWLEKISNIISHLENLENRNSIEKNVAK